MSTFEQSVATLAENRLSVEHPNLMEYRRGFVLFDFDESERTAMGAYRFLIGNVRSLMPIIVDNGSVSGMDILILRDVSLFVPAIDGWINALAEMGDKDIVELGKQADDPKGASAVVLQFSRFPYALKTASAELDPQEYKALTSAFAKVDAESIRKVMTEPPTKKAAMLGSTPLRALHKAASDDPAFAARVVDLYGEDLLQKAAATAEHTAHWNLLTGMKPLSKVYTITDMADPRARSLKPAQKRRLIQTGQFIVDKRAETETATLVDIPKVSELDLTNNPRYGMYDVLDDSGKLVPMHVFPVITTCNIVDNSAVEPAALTEGNKTTKVLLFSPRGKLRGEFKATDLWVTPRAVSREQATGSGTPVPGKKASKASLDALLSEKQAQWRKKASSEFEPPAPACMDIVVLDGKAAHPLYVRKEGNGAWRAGSRAIKFSPEYSRVLKDSTAVYIPTKAKLVLDTADNTVQFIPGNKDMLKDKVAKRVGGTPLAVNLRGDKIIVDSKEIQHVSYSLNDAMQHLVFDLGVSAPAASKLIGRTAASEGKSVEMVLKKAITLGEPDVGALKQSLVKRTESVRGMGDLAKWGRDLSQVADVADDPDEFDEKLMRRFVEMTDFREVGLDTIRALIRAMDQCGKLLLRVLVHKDEYIKRYNEEDAERLETSCRKNFIGNGDLVLFLREKRGSAGEVDDELLVNLLTEDMSA